MEKYIFFREDLCYICHDKITKNYICSQCLSNLEYIDGKFDLGDNFCYYPFFYNNFLQNIIQEYKFKKKTYLVKPLSILLAQYISKNTDVSQFDFITYIPMDKRRKYKRGYNQVELLVEYLSYILKIPMIEVLKKNRRTKEQNKLGAKERKENLKGSFLYCGDCIIDGKKILLIDDLVTTGATLQEVSRVLLNYGAYVEAFVLTSSRINKE